MNLLLLSLLAGCFETPLDEGACRTEADCTDGMRCFDADDPFYGDCQDAVRDCEDDPSCGDGNVCEEYPTESPCNPDDLSSSCVLACQDDDDCDEGQRCNLSTGHCVTWLCTDGYTCPIHFTCTDGAEGTGCVRDACEGDEDCGDGWCVNGNYFADAGFCSYSPP